jgi:hypothetical protein
MKNLKYRRGRRVGVRRGYPPLSSLHFPAIYPSPLPCSLPHLCSVPPSLPSLHLSSPPPPSRPSPFRPSAGTDCVGIGWSAGRAGGSGGGGGWYAEPRRGCRRQGWRRRRGGDGDDALGKRGSWCGSGGAAPLRFQPTVSAAPSRVPLPAPPNLNPRVGPWLAWHPAG